MDKILEQIPKMKIRDTLNLWRNAIGVLSDPNKSKQHALARSIINAIGREWVNRYRKPINPNEAFKWPGTEANPGSGDLLTEDWIKEGVLQFMGYKVGNANGEPQGIRERILSEIFVGPIPPVFPASYLQEWGRPSSVARLQKMAETIAALTRNAKRRRDSQMTGAIRDWEKDLEYLHQEYYIGKFRFSWPVSTI